MLLCSKGKLEELKALIETFGLTLKEVDNASCSYKDRSNSGNAVPY